MFGARVTRRLVTGSFATFTVHFDVIRLYKCRIGSHFQLNIKRFLLLTDKTEKLRARRLIESSPETNSHKLIMDAVKSEINKTLTSLKPKAFCSTKEQICVQGPPGMPGLKGSRGKRGPRGNTGRKGSRGPIGNPGPHGKLGISGPPGQKGTQGVRGIQGPRGFPGAKGEPGESISTPTVVISPITQTVRENQNAVFQCSATGNPKPRVTWLRSDRSWTPISIRWKVRGSSRDSRRRRKVHLCR